MTVKDLITKLQKFDPERIVVIAGWEEGFDTIDDVDAIQLKRTGGTPSVYCGEYAEDHKGEIRGVRIR